MDPAASPSPLASLPDNDEWDAEGFEIPSLNTNKTKPVEEPPPPLHKAINTTTENLYLGPHGAKPGLRPSQHQQEAHAGKKQRFKQKLKSADQRSNGFGRENKVEVLRDLVGSRSASVLATSRDSGEWLDPHCHESMFDRQRK